MGKVARVEMVLAVGRGGWSLLTIETSSRLILFSTFLGSHPRKTVFYLINRFPGMSNFQGSIESWFSGNFQLEPLAVALDKEKWSMCIYLEPIG
ncbi:hypothetical protein DY000_02015500 [Brassica cretica]|uniref:Uncharacterized protein n=1 Tax=Brassica cretica TaxID=69181 RepID=A0ABQ7D1P5_BRACR|nr:hypothetical protein DY000_02015500 [Brassica cretica]